jgi:hypothetical protein
MAMRSEAEFIGRHKVTPPTHSLIERVRQEGQ